MARKKGLIAIVVPAAIVVLAEVLFIYTDEKEVSLNIPLSKKSSESCYVEDSLSYSKYKKDADGVEDNNKFGLYIYAQENYVDIAAKLVNSSGGDWGYVLIPFNIKDRDYLKWRKIFLLLRQKHLIPIIQLWDVDVDNYKDQTRKAADFLDIFPWPIRQRYISVYNETNDSRFWKGKLDPAEYAGILDFTIKEFKDESKEFFMLNGAFNISAPNGDGYMDAQDYMFLMDKEIPGIFNKLDGWASHPYPQPNFSGDPYAVGRWSIRAYENELNYLEDQLHLKKELPVFITETGWAHAEGENYNSGFLPVSKVAEYFKVAYEDVWLKDDRVVAVTPFTVRYDPPYDHFSWVDLNLDAYEHFEVVKGMRKVSGNPEALVSLQIKSLGCYK